MKVNHVENEFSTTGFSPQDSLNGASGLVKKFLTRAYLHEDKITDWQLILSQSKAIGCLYDDEKLPQQNWEWPKNTWFQGRMSRHLQDLE